MRVVIVTVACIPWATGAFAGTPPSSFHTGFIENKGQLVDQRDRSNPAVLYLLPGEGHNVQLRRSGFSYDFFSLPEPPMSHDPEERMGAELPNEKFLTLLHRIDFELVGADGNCLVEASGASASHLNYYTYGTPAGGATGVLSYSRVLYRGIYPHIDLEFFNSNGEFKYNFIVHPGGRVADILLRVEGADEMALHDGALRISTRFGAFEERVPYCYALDGANRIEVRGAFAEVGPGIYGFSIEGAEAFDGSDLVIDPVPDVEWCSYYGAADYDDYFDMDVRPLFGDRAVCGRTVSTSGFATSGTHQDSLWGDYDAFVFVFGSNDSLKWCSYFGGTDYDAAGSIVFDIYAIYIGGATYSTDNITTMGGYLNGFGDGFIARFDHAGDLVTSRYFGGNGSEGVNSLTLLPSGNLVFGGRTNSDSDLSTSGAHQENYAGWDDTYVCEVSSLLSTQWATYYGGTDDEWFSDLTVDDQGNIYMCGRTSSTDSIATPGSYDEDYSPGGGQAFVVKFAEDGHRIWGSYYGGPDVDEFKRITYGGGRLYVLGRSIDFPTTPGAFCPVNNIPTYQEAHIVALDTSSILIWATYFSGNGGSTLLSIDASDDGGEVFVSGATTSTDPFFVTSDAYSSNPDHRGVLAKFNGAGVLQWGTFYGLSNGGEVVTVKYTQPSTIHAAGPAAFMDGLATPGAYQTTLAGSEDVYMTRFIECDLLPDDALSISGPLTGCPGQVVDYTTPPVANADEYDWTLPPGWIVLSGADSSNVSVQIGSLGGAVTVLPRNSCGTGGAASIAVDVEPLPTPTITGSSTATVGMMENYSTPFTPNDFLWSAPNGTILSGQGTELISVEWALPGLTWVVVEETSAFPCTGSDSLQVQVGPSGVNDMAPFGPIVLAPVPVRDELAIHFGPGLRINSITILDAQGQLVSNARGEAGTSPLLIDVHSLAAGSYAARILADDAVYQARFVVER